MLPSLEPHPSPEAGRTGRGRGQGTGEGARGCSGAGGLLALDGDLAAALAVLLVGGDLGRLDDQQPLRGQGGEHRDGIHLVGQPAGGQETRHGLGCCIPAGPRPSQPQRQSLCYCWSAWECAGIFGAGCWPPWELCLISPADVFDGMSAARSRSKSRPCRTHVSREPSPKRSPRAASGARPSLPVGLGRAQGSSGAEKRSRAAASRGNPSHALGFDAVPCSPCEPRGWDLPPTSVGARRPLGSPLRLLLTKRARAESTR